MSTIDTRAGGRIEEAARGRAAFGRLCATGFLAYCSYAICRMPLLPLLATELGADPPAVGLIVGASTLTGVFLKLPAGACSDVLGRRPMLLLGTAVFATLPFTYLGVASLGALFALRAVHGSATAIFGPVASASISDIAPPDRRATWLSTYSTIQGVGQTLGPIVAGYLIGAGRFDVAFIVAGLLALSTPLMAARWPSNAGPAAVTATGTRLNQFVLGVSEVCRRPLILMTSAAQAAQFALHGTLSAFLPLFARDVLGLAPSALGWLFALQTATTLAARPVMGMFADRVRRHHVIVAGLTLCSCGVFLLSLARDLPLLLGSVVGYAIGVAVTSAAASALITDLSRRARYGAAHGVFGTIYDVGDALGPILGGILVATIGYAATFQALATMVLAVAVSFGLASRRLTKHALL